MRYFCGDVVKVQAFIMKPSYRKIWSNAQINMKFDNGCIGHLTGSYDMSGNHPIERCEVAGTEGRFIIENVFESLTFMPRRSPERIVYPNNIFGGVGSFRDTFRNRINRFVEQVDSGAKPDEIEASGADGLAAQKVIESAIISFETGDVVEIK
jgi:predicted dehydrogenase